MYFGANLENCTTNLNKLSGAMAKLSPTKFVFDNHDMTPIGLLRKDGRAPVSKPAEIIGVSRATVQTQLGRLLASGAFWGFIARVHEDYGINQIRAITMIEVWGRNTTQVINLTALTAMHTTSGNWSLIAEVLVENLSEFDSVLREVRLVDGVLNSETSVLLSSI
ncbi:Lrp/AsnC family transcriptional regulator [Antarctobacter sp.]|uniref:Lrp/AsnC family transcriptional regulator n=1 Tax=Antarctobacter sp. TaxID=1872577 RepID=UPI002B27A7F1|nr:Lrp/AsnC family transcriptional regulator [Antarctobacter sp.]